MSQRDSGYERKEADFYPTPEWVTRALIPHLPRKPVHIWECAVGDGHMLSPLQLASDVYGTDLRFGDDFLARRERPFCDVDAIITNPPYDLATEFIEHALRLIEPVGGLVAMLLRTDFDHAKSRSHLFRDCPAFAKKVVLTKRIMWFEPEPGAKGKSPSFNHAWYIWDWKHEGAPSLAYGP
jgi:hypothetical protein